MAEERHACGFILAAIVDGEARYLLLRNANHGTWGAPKGHTEPGEEPFQAALRETEEETGLRDLNVVDGFEETFSYEVDTRRGRYLKHVTYWLATVPEPVHTPSDEHDESAWLTINEALNHLQYEQLRKVFQKADARLRQGA